MRTVWVPEAILPGGPSIFLAGPTPRSPEVASWRPEALKALAEAGFDGTVYLPEPRSKGVSRSYDEQVGWETDALTAATCIMFWVPRDLAPDANGYPRMGALTTNVEFGAWMKSGKAVLGYPPAAQKMGYLMWHAQREGVPVHHDLASTVQEAMNMALRWP